MSSLGKQLFVAATFVLIAGQSWAEVRNLEPDCQSLLVTKEGRSLDPESLYGPLFRQVQTSGIFRDSKYFVDMEPRFAPFEIVARYLREQPKTRAQLLRFVKSQFDVPPTADLSAFKATPGMSAGEYIRRLWPALTRGTVHPPPGSSLLKVEGPHVVPGGRFREIYYWDSYFTQLGLIEDGQIAIFDNMVRLFNDMLMKHGRISNGSRTYYRNRSQPPFFAMMVSLWQQQHGKRAAIRFLPALKKEYDFWMSGREKLAPFEALERVVSVEDGGVLNRYWVDNAEPRPEAYQEDIELARLAAKELGRAPEDVYRDLGAGTESGWDYSTRWMADPKRFASIQTTALVPIDLNSLLWSLENKIAELSGLDGDLKTALRFREAADRRARLIHKYLYDAQSGTFRDYNWKTRSLSPELTIAMAAPLFVGLASPQEADRVLSVIEKSFLQDGGVRTTLKASAQQWDGDNGWAPCQWMTYVAAMRYRHESLAEAVRTRWLRANDLTFAATGEMKEKYNVVNITADAKGGEYESQFGFGWSNGVYKAFTNPKRALRHVLGEGARP